MVGQKFMMFKNGNAIKEVNFFPYFDLTNGILGTQIFAMDDKKKWQTYQIENLPKQMYKFKSELMTYSDC